MTENEKIELFDKWYDENYDEWAEGEEGIALREELEQAFKSGITTLEKENAELNQKVIDLENDREIFLSDFYCDKKGTCKLTKAKTYLKYFIEILKKLRANKEPLVIEAEQFLKEDSISEHIQRAKYNYID